MKGLKVLLRLTALTLIFVAVWQNVEPFKGMEVTCGLDLYWVKWATNPFPVLFLCPVAFFSGLALMYFVNMITIFRLRKRVKSLENMPSGSFAYSDHASPGAPSRPEQEADRQEEAQEASSETSPQS